MCSGGSFMQPIVCNQRVRCGHIYRDPTTINRKLQHGDWSRSASWLEDE